MTCATQDTAVAVTAPPAPRRRVGRPRKGEGKDIPDFVLWLREDTPPGRCCMCGDRPAKGYTCGEQECREAYTTAWHAERSLRLSAERAAARAGRAQPGPAASHRHPDRVRFTPESPLTPDEKRQRRQQGLALLNNGRGVREVARLLRVSEDAVSQWKRRARLAGGAR